MKLSILANNVYNSLKKWFAAIYISTSHKKGISSLQLGRDLGVTQKTAWFMLQRIRHSFAFNNTHTLSNEVEIDETFVGGKNKNRHAGKKVENSQGRSFKDKSPVLGMIERNGNLMAKQMVDTKSETLTPEVIKVVRDTANVYTDEWLGYKGLTKLYDHSFVRHNENEYVNGRIHTNSIEGFWSLLKRGIFGIYHSTSKKHLQKYVDEFVFRYNTRKIESKERFNLFLSTPSTQLTYNDLIKNKN